MQAFIENAKRLAEARTERRVVHKRFSIQEIRVHKTGKQHPRAEDDAEGELWPCIFEREARNHRGNIGENILIGHVVPVSLCLAAELCIERRAFLRVGRDAAVRKARVMARNAIGKQGAVGVFVSVAAEHFRARRGVLHLLRVFGQAPLPCGRALPDIVQQPREARGFLAAEFGGEICGKFCDVVCVLGKRLNAAVLALVRNQFQGAPPKEYSLLLYGLKQ